MEPEKAEAVKEFPGLYAGSKTGEDESRNFLSAKKKKEKDRGYKTFGEDGSGASCEDVAKTPSSRLFKFAISVSKTTATKPVKVKLFGVDLREVMRRNPSVDPKSPKVPKFLNDMLIYIEEQYKPDLNFYKGTSNFKSKIHQARHALNYGQDYVPKEPQITAGLVKLFLRELPSHILGSVMESKLEEMKPTEKKTQKIQGLYLKEVSDVNKGVFERLVLHMEIIGIDLTPLLRVSQKALAVLKPVMSPLSIEDELKVEEARLARIHLAVAKVGESKDKSKAKRSQDQEKLWEAQRNVTQLKRKLKQTLSTNASHIKEVEMNLEERLEGEPSEATSEADAARHDEVAADPNEEKDETTRVSHIVADGLGRSEELPGQIRAEEVSIGRPHPSRNELPDSGSSKVDSSILTESRVETKQGPSEAKCETSPATELMPDQIPHTAYTSFPKMEAESADRSRDVLYGSTDQGLDEEKGKSAEHAAREHPTSRPLSQTAQGILSGKEELEANEVLRLQLEWKSVIGEQAELLRMKDEIRRRIRDEHKQIKMIQMVRNHRSRLNPMKPAGDDPLGNMSTEKLRDVLQRLIDSNDELTHDAQALSERVFDERMNLVHLRTLKKAPLCS